MEAALCNMTGWTFATCSAAYYFWHADEVTEQRGPQPARRAAASTFLWPTVGIPPPIISEAAGFDSPVGRADYIIKLL